MKPDDERRRAANDLVLARMRVRGFVEATEDPAPEALGKSLEGLSFEAALTACFEALEDE